MPIDANVYSQLDTQAPLRLTALFDPANQRARQLKQMQDEETYAQLEDSRTLRSLMRNAGTTDPSILAQKASEAGLYKPAQEFRTQASATERARRDQEKAAMDAVKAKLDALDPFLGMMFADPSDEGLARTASQMVQLGVFTPEDAQALTSGLPPDINERRKRFAMAALSPQDRAKSAGVLPQAQGGIGNYNPGDYTPESFAAFLQSRNPGDLKRYVTPAQPSMQIINGVPSIVDKNTGRVRQLSTQEAEFEAARSKEAAKSSGSEAGKAAGKSFSMIDGQKGALESIAEAKSVLDKGIYTGTAAEWRKSGAKALGLVGGNTDKAARTEEFIAYIGNVVVPRLQEFGGNDSNEEMRYLQRINAGDISMEPQALRRILESAERKISAGMKRAENRMRSPTNPAAPQSPNIDDLLKKYGG